jgi:RNA polymerase sigma factor (sigma-70 family)
MPETPNIDAKIPLAVGGDLVALQEVLREIQHPIYRIALRMLGNAADAEDACQEVLLKVTTALSTFRGDSQFSTWVHRIAVNHVLSELRQKSIATTSFDDIANGLNQGMAYAANQTAASTEDSALAFEVFVNCTQRLLTALDTDDRIAYVLGDLCDIPGAQASEVLQITPAAFRQRLSRARRQLASFFDEQCGVANSANACRCAAQVPAARAVGYVHEARLTYSKHPLQTADSRLPLSEISRTVQELEALVCASRILISQGDFAAPHALVDRLREVLASGKYRVLQ